jgi:hypothetical protein
MKGMNCLRAQKQYLVPDPQHWDILRTPVPTLTDNKKYRYKFEDKIGGTGTLYDED